MSDNVLSEVSEDLQRLTEIRSELVRMMDRNYVRGREYGEKNPKPPIDTSVIAVEKVYEIEQDAYKKGYVAAMNEIEAKVRERFWLTRDGSKAEDFGFQTLQDILNQRNQYRS